jgi:hypothetical protein
VKPTARDLAQSAADLRRYAERFRLLASHGDHKGEVAVKSAMLAMAGDFFDAVSEELIALIGEHEPEPPAKNRPAEGAYVGSGGEPRA